jgi:predicted RNase H-like HicB family nuclease
MRRFLMVIEKAYSNYSTYLPDLPGCVATGKTRAQAAKNIHQAIEMHVQGMREDRTLHTASQYSWTHARTVYNRVLFYLLRCRISEEGCITRLIEHRALFCNFSKTSGD